MFTALSSAWSSLHASSSRIASQLPTAPARAFSSTVSRSAAAASLGDLAPAKGSKQAVRFVFSASPRELRKHF